MIIWLPLVIKTYLHKWVQHSGVKMQINQHYFRDLWTFSLCDWKDFSNMKNVLWRYPLKLNSVVCLTSCWIYWYLIHTYRFCFLATEQQSMIHWSHPWIKCLYSVKGFLILKLKNWKSWPRNLKALWELFLSICMF